METAALLSLAILFGGMTVFSFLFAPLVFTQLDGATAGRFIRTVFPWYYLLVFAFGAIGAVTISAVNAWAGLTLGSIALLAVLCRQVLMPWINRLRDRELAGDLAAAGPFKALHRLTVAINFAQIFAAGGTLTIWTLGPWL